MQTTSIINKYIAGFLILAIGAFLLFGLSEFINAFLGSLIFYILFKKFMAYLVFKKGFNKSFSALIIILISFLIVVLPIGVLGTIILKEISELTSNTEAISHYTTLVSQKLTALKMNISVENITGKVTRFVSELAGSVLSSSMNILGSLTMMYFLLYFLLVNVRLLEVKVTYFLPFEDEQINLFAQELKDQTRGNAIGITVVALIQGIAAYIAYLIVGLPEPGVYAILTGFTSIIPIVGTALIWIPITIFLFANNQVWEGTFLIIFCVVVLTNIDNIVRMYVSKKIGDVHPVTTVLGVIIGLKFFNLPGLVFGPLLISYFLLFLKLYHENYKTKPQPALDEFNTEEKGILMRFIERFNLQKKPTENPPTEE